jgi:hypothetical protein
MKEIINQVYEEAIKCAYSKTPARSKAIEDLIPLVEKYDRVYDFCPEEMELVDAVEHVEALIPDKDMHMYLAQMEPLNADLIVVRHVAEHSVMPFVLLRALQGHTSRVLLIVPEDNDLMINYRNHYSVLSRKAWENLFNKSGWTHEYLGSKVFQGSGSKEWRYLLTK